MAGKLWDSDFSELASTEYMHVSDLGPVSNAHLILILVKHYYKIESCHQPLGWLCAMDQNKLGNRALHMYLLCSRRSIGHVVITGTLVVSLF